MRPPVRTVVGGLVAVAELLVGGPGGGGRAGDRWRSWRSGGLVAVVELALGGEAAVAALALGVVRSRRPSWRSSSPRPRPELALGVAVALRVAVAVADLEPIVRGCHTEAWNTRKLVAGRPGYPVVLTH